MSLPIAMAGGTCSLPTGRSIRQSSRNGSPIASPSRPPTAGRGSRSCRISTSTSPAGCPRAAGVDLPELNLRTYVSRDGEPGVYFFSLDAAGASGSWARVSSIGFPTTTPTSKSPRPTAESRLPASAVIRARPPPGSSAPTSRSGTRSRPTPARSRRFSPSTTATTRRLETHASLRRHRSRAWTLRAATATVETNTLFEANGFEPPAGSPVCYYSRGVDIASSRNRQWE